MSMTLKDTLICGALALGSPLLLYASTLKVGVSCDVNQQAQTVTATAKKSEIYWLTALLGIGQGYLAYRLLRKASEQEAVEPAALAQPLGTRIAGQPASRELAPSTASAVPTRHARPLNLGSAALEAESVEMDVQPTIVTRRQESYPAPTTATQKTAIPTEYLWAQDLIHYPAVLIYGAQGSGKTSFVAWLIRQRLKAGHTVEVLDPHRKFGQWQGLKVCGDGMDYAGIDRAMSNFAKRVKVHYQRHSQQPNYNPPYRTTVAEEFTHWASRCDNSADFFGTALSDIRKVNECVVFVSHARTMTGLGNAKGLADTRDASLLELELEAKVDPDTGEAVPALKGRLKYPGGKTIAVEIATWMKGEMDFTSLVSPPVEPAPAPQTQPDPIQLRAQLEGMWEASPSFPPPETKPETVSESETNSETVFKSEPSEEAASTVRADAETVSVLFPETTEDEVFRLIQAGYEDRLSPSDIVKKQLKMTQTDRYPIGKAVCVYLVRKHGNADLFIHFRKWLEA